MSVTICPAFLHFQQHLSLTSIRPKNQAKPVSESEAALNALL